MANDIDYDIDYDVKEMNDYLDYLEEKRRRIEEDEEKEYM